VDDRLSTREMVAVLLASDRAPDLGIAALGAAQSVKIQEQHGKADKAANEAHYVMIGRATISARDANRPEFYDRAVAVIAAEILLLKKRIAPMAFEEAAHHIELHQSAIVAPEYVAAVAAAGQAMYEHVWGVCPVCVGRGEVPDHEHTDLEGRQPMKVCPECGGSKKRNFNDEDRAKRVGGKIDRRHLRDWLELAETVIRRAESITQRHYIEQLKFGVTK
jgi:rubrerythrin